MHGLLIVDKPAGVTSAKLVRRLRAALRVKKAGHGGTLDPFATGVLPVFLGKATRLVQFLHHRDKEYRATVELGRATDTMDPEGEVVAEAPVPNLSRDEVSQALEGLQGELLQRVPLFSAVRVGGERLHRLARRGEAGVERPTRRVVIHSLTLDSWTPPLLGFTVRCSTGTYVRSLAEDLATRLGTVGHLVALRRLRVGSFSLTGALDPEEFQELDRDLAAERLVPMEDILPELPRIDLDARDGERVLQGQKLGAGFVPGASPQGALVRLVAPWGLAAIGEVLEGRRGISVVRAFPP